MNDFQFSMILSNLFIIMSLQLSQANERVFAGLMLVFALCAFAMAIMSKVFA